jgi:hypothetical protein
MAKFCISCEGWIDDNGRLQLADRIGFVSAISNLRGKRVLVKVQDDVRKRSSKQNNYYWGVILPFVKELLNETGWNYSIEDVHDYLRSEFCYKEMVNTETGEIRRIIMSTTNLTTVGFSEYIERINGFVVENFGCSLPESESVKIESQNLFLE